MTPRPALDVKYRKTFEDFSSDPKMVAQLKKLYKTPDDVDFVVGAYDLICSKFHLSDSANNLLLYRCPTVRYWICHVISDPINYILCSEEELFPGTTMPVKSFSPDAKLIY